MPAYSNEVSIEIGGTLGSVTSGSAVSAVARRLLDSFTGGDLASGTRLPPERALATSLGVGRSAVREALAALEILGIVEVRPGSGTYLRGNASELLPQTLSWGLMLGEARTRELIEVRRGLEINAAILAATRITDAEIAALESHLQDMRSSAEDLQRFVEADRMFHVQIALSSGNLVLQQLLQNVRSLLRIWVERALHDEEGAAEAIAEHTDVFDALRARSPESVASAMEIHMRTAGNRLVAAIDPPT